MTLDKIAKILDEETIAEMNALDGEALQKLIVDSEQAVRQAKEELEANEKYQELKESLKAVRSGFTEVKKRQNAKIQLALIRLEELGK